MHKTKNFLKKTILFSCILTVSLTLQLCQSSTGVSTQVPIKVISYEIDIKPMMLKNCTPCHFPELGKKKMLDTYEATKNNIDEILKRVQLPKDSAEFMPFKSKREPWTIEEINRMKDWVKTGMSK